MACLVRILGNHTLGCGTPTNGPLMKPQGAYIIYAFDIASYTIAAGGAVTWTLRTGTVGIPIEAGNNALTITVGVKGGEVAAQMFDVTAEFSFFSEQLYSAMDGSAVRHGPNSQIVLAVDHGNGIYKVYGLGHPLECLSVEGDTTGNGFPRVTFGVEDWQVGTTITSITKAQYDALATPVPAPEPKP